MTICAILKRFLTQKHSKKNRKLYIENILLKMLDMKLKKLYNLLI